MYAIVTYNYVQEQNFRPTMFNYPKLKTKYQSFKSNAGINLISMTIIIQYSRVVTLMNHQMFTFNMIL